METILNESNFEKEVLQNDITVLVDFLATWCGPCKMFAPTIDEIANEYRDKVKVCKLDIDKYPRVAAKYNIMSVPTVVIFKNGQEFARGVGLIQKERLTELL